LKLFRNKHAAGFVGFFIAKLVILQCRMCYITGFVHGFLYDLRYLQKADFIDQKTMNSYFVGCVQDNPIRQAKLKAAQNGASVYMYLFAWQTPALDGIHKAFHCAEIPFAFNNIALTEYTTT